MGRRLTYENICPASGHLAEKFWKFERFSSFSWTVLIVNKDEDFVGWLTALIVDWVEEGPFITFSLVLHQKQLTIKIRPPEGFVFCYVPPVRVHQIHIVVTESPVHTVMLLKIPITVPLPIGNWKTNFMNQEWSPKSWESLQKITNAMILHYEKWLVLWKPTCRSLMM